MVKSIIIVLGEESCHCCHALGDVPVFVIVLGFSNIGRIITVCAIMSM